MSVQEGKFLFALRSRMLDVKANYSEKHSDGDIVFVFVLSARLTMFSRG